MAHFIVQIAAQIQNDADALRTCCQLVQEDFAIILDLDIFDIVKAVSEEQDTPRITEAFQTGHLKLDLFLREVHRPDTELIRVAVERSRNSAIPESRIFDTFRAIMENQSCKFHFTFDNSTLFGLSKTRCCGDPCSRLWQTFREVLADQDPPNYNGDQNKSVTF